MQLGSRACGAAAAFHCTSREELAGSVAWLSRDEFLVADPYGCPPRESAGTRWANEVQCADSMRTFDRKSSFGESTK
jgi:hypothetical protein